MPSRQRREASENCRKIGPIAARGHMVFWQIDMFEPTRLLPAWDGIPLIDAVRSYAPGFIPWAAAAENNFRLLKIEAKPLQPQQQNQSHCEADGYIFISCPVSSFRARFLANAIPSTDVVPGRA